MQRLRKARYTAVMLKNHNAHNFVPRNELDRAVLHRVMTRVELAFINRDLKTDSFDLGCALARSGQTARDIRARIKESKERVASVYHALPSPHFLRRQSLENGPR